MSLTATDIVFRRGERIILDGVNLAIAEGDVVALLGTNGAGKSTLLRIMLGLLEPAQGSVTLNDRPLAKTSRRDIARRVAYVPQSHAAHFPYTVTQVIAMGRVPQAGLGRRLSAKDEQAIARVMARLDIETLAPRVYTELSGGERQRVLLARALVQEATLLVMDEPLAGLDFGQQLRMLDLMRQLARAGYGILHTTHRPDETLQGSTRAVLLQQGRIIADGPPHEVVHAASMATFYGVELEQIDAGQQRFFRHLSDGHTDDHKA